MGGGERVLVVLQFSRIGGAMQAPKTISHSIIYTYNMYNMEHRSHFLDPKVFSNSNCYVLFNIIFIN